MNHLFMFVEGPDDERFLQHIYCKNNIHYIQYRHYANKDINNKLRSIKYNSMVDYLFFTDADGCSIEERIKRTVEKYRDCEETKVCVVQFEIESWYLAGLKQEVAQRMKIKPLACTDCVKKEQFNDLIPKQYARVDFMRELLKQYDYEVARSQNASFRLFFDKWGKEQVI